MIYLKKSFILITFLVLLLSCQEDNTYDDTNITKIKEKSKFEKPTVADALSFINSNLLSKNNYSARGIADYKLEIDSTYVIPKDNKPFLKLVSFKPEGYALVSDIDNVLNPPVLFFDQNKFNKQEVNPALVEYIQEFYQIIQKKVVPQPMMKMKMKMVPGMTVETLTRDPRDENTN